MYKYFINHYEIKILKKPLRFSVDIKVYKDDGSHVYFNMTEKEFKSHLTDKLLNKEYMQSWIETQFIKLELET